MLTRVIPLLPTGIQNNALYQQAVFVELSHFHHCGMLAASEIRGWQWVFFYSNKPLNVLRMFVDSYILFFEFSTRKQGLTPDKETFEKHTTELSGKLEVYDEILSKQKYLLGDVSRFLLSSDTWAPN